MKKRIFIILLIGTILLFLTSCKKEKPVEKYNFEFDNLSEVIIMKDVKVDLSKNVTYKSIITMTDTKDVTDNINALKYEKVKYYPEAGDYQYYLTLGDNKIMIIDQEYFVFDKYYCRIVSGNITFLNDYEYIKIEDISGFSLSADVKQIQIVQKVEDNNLIVTKKSIYLNVQEKLDDVVSNLNKVILHKTTKNEGGKEIYYLIINEKTIIIYDHSLVKIENDLYEIYQGNIDILDQYDTHNSDPKIEGTDWLPWI